MREKIIISFTSWAPRFENIPRVLDSIYAQTLLPDKVVFNLSKGDTLPESILQYLENHNVEIYEVPDTKVYKKLLPTLMRYPNDCIIAIDDDWIYPKTMIEDFVELHHLYPNNPISGNRVFLHGLKCHCGCASLTKAEYFGNYISCIDEEVIKNCLSDDIVYSFFATKAGHPYVFTRNEYFENMQECTPASPYTQKEDNQIWSTINYLNHRFGVVMLDFSNYLTDPMLKELYQHHIVERELQSFEQGCAKIRLTHSYRLGAFLLKPFKWIKGIIS